MENINLVVLSDSTGDTGDQIARAALAQFDVTCENAKFHLFGHIRSIEHLNSTLNKCLEMDNIIIYYSLVEESLIDSLKKFCDMHNLISVDILTPSIVAIQRLTKRSPATNPGALRKLDEHYFRRIDAIEFAVRYDDGKDPRGVSRADITIIGVSRTSKTPLSMYLANKHYKVCNIPLVPESPVPKELFEIEPKRVIGLTNSPDKLNKIRKERLKSMGLPTESTYSDLGRILDELDYAEKIMKKIGCPIVNVSDRAIEETAEVIIRHLKKMND